MRLRVASAQLRPRARRMRLLSLFWPTADLGFAKRSDGARGGAKAGTRRVEAAEAFEQGGRVEKAADERAELSILEQYLPEQLDVEALAAIVERVLNDGGYKTMADMGQAMKAVNAEVAGKAEGRTVAELVKSHLS